MPSRKSTWRSRRQPRHERSISKGRSVDHRHLANVSCSIGGSGGNACLQRAFRPPWRPQHPTFMNKNAFFDGFSCLRWLLVVAFPEAALAQPYAPPDRGAPGDEMIQGYLRTESDKLEANFLGP